MMTRSRRLCIGALLVLAMVVAPASAALAKAAPSGFRTVNIAKAGFSIAVPNDWVSVDTTKGDVAKALTKVRKTFPSLSGALPANAKDVFAHHLQLLVLENAGAAVPARVNAILFPQDAKFSKSSIQQELTQVDPGVVVATVKVAGKAGVKATIHLTGNAADGSTSQVVATQYFVKGPKGALEFTFSAPADDPRTEIFDTMIASLALAH